MSYPPILPKNIRNSTTKNKILPGTAKPISESGYMNIKHILSGAIKYVVNEKEKILFSGDTLVLNPYDEGYYESLGAATYFSFCIDRQKHFDELCIPALTVFNNFIPRDTFISLLITKINNEYENQQPFHENMLISLTDILLIHLYRNYSHAAVSMPSQSLLGKHRIAQRAVEYIYENCHKGVTTSEISKHINVSSSHLCRCFKEATGVTVTEYAERLRCRKAAEDLALGLYSVTQVAEKYHFGSLSYFNRCYKRYCGTNPAKALAEAKKRRWTKNSDA